MTMKRVKKSDLCKDLCIVYLLGGRVLLYILHLSLEISLIKYFYLP